jgi:hypothetical protein
MGLKPQATSKAGTFSLDYAIEDPRTGLYGLGVECDAPRHRLLEKARAREVWRPRVLAKSIPVVHRVSSQGWLDDPAQEQELLRNAVKRALT